MGHSENPHSIEPCVTQAFVSKAAIDAILAPKLKGLFFSGPNQKSNSTAEGIVVQGISLPDKKGFYKEICPFLGESITMDRLEAIRQKIIRYYKSNDFPVVGVFIPDGQDISAGNVHFIILEGRLEKIEASGARWFSNQKIADKIRTKPGETIQWTRMHSDLEWINTNPFYKTTLVFEPGETLGETNVQLLTEDQFPLRTFAGYENTGNIIAGPSRYLTGFNWGNAFGLNHQLNGLFFTAPSIDKCWGAVGGYIMPLPWRNILQVNGAYTRARPNIGEGLDMNGIAWQALGRYWVPFYTLNLNHQIAVGYDFKRTNNFLNFANTLIFSHFIDVSQFVLEYEGILANSISNTSFNLTFYLSPGGMTPYNKDPFFAQDRPGATSNYIYGKLRLDEILYFPRNWTWVFNGLFQQATGKLLPSEELSLGGFATVRGYEENEAIGDNGLLVKNELRTPPIKFPTIKKWRHELQFLGFSDFGWSYDVDQTILSTDTIFLASLGAGVRYNFGTYVAIRFDYGWQLHTIHRLENPSNFHSRGHFGGTIAF